MPCPTAAPPPRKNVFNLKTKPPSHQPTGPCPWMRLSSWRECCYHVATSCQNPWWAMWLRPGNMFVLHGRTWVLAPTCIYIYINMVCKLLDPLYPWIFHYNLHNYFLLNSHRVKWCKSLIFCKKSSIYSFSIANLAIEESEISRKNPYGEELYTVFFPIGSMGRTVYLPT